MRTRAYRPEVPVGLEERALLSGAAGPSAHPVVLLARRLDVVVYEIRVAFELFARDIEPVHLLDEIQDVEGSIPFEHVDGLDASIQRIVDRMRVEVSAHVPHAIRAAQNDVLAAIRAEVAARVRAGDVVVR